MRTLTFSERIPSAFITTNGNRFKIYDGEKIFLTDKQNFEIRLFNPLKEKIGAEIILNGKGTGRILVLNPGVDITLDRFLEEKRKMVFETYTINANNEIAKKAIEENGSIVIKFYKEKYMLQVYSYDGISLNWQTNGTYIGIGAPSPTHDLQCFTGQTAVVNNPVETGRVEKGDTSNQTIKQVQVEFETVPFMTIKYKLLPVSQYKEVVDYQVKQYCPNCGSRIPKQSWKYCPKCGEKL